MQDVSNRKKTRIGAQMYTLRNYIKTPAEIDTTFDRLNKMGYKYIQISAFGQIAPEELKGLMDKHNIIPIGYHITMDTLRNDFEKLVANLKLWDVKYCAVSYLAPQERPDAQAYKNVAKEMSSFGKKLFEEYGVHLQYHNHSFEFEKLDGKLALEIIYEESDPRYLQAELDTYWVARGGCNPVDWINRLVGRLDQIHFKDITILNNGQDALPAEIGEGNLNWTEIIKACKKAKVKDYLIEQDECPITKDPFRSLEISLKNTKALLNIK